MPHDRTPIYYRGTNNEGEDDSVFVLVSAFNVPGHEDHYMLVDIINGVVLGEPFSISWQDRWSGTIKGFYVELIDEEKMIEIVTKLLVEREKLKGQGTMAWIWKTDGTREDTQPKHPNGFTREELEKMIGHPIVFVRASKDHNIVYACQARIEVGTINPHFPNDSHGGTFVGTVVGCIESDLDIELRNLIAVLKEKYARKGQE